MIDFELSDLFLQSSVDKQFYITTDDGEVIDNTLLHSESFELTESICSETEITFGACEASCVKFTMSNEGDSLKGQWITITVVLDGNEDYPFQIGRYKVYSDVKSADRLSRDITAYDAMYDIINADVAEWYEEYFTENDTVTLKQFRADFAAYFDLEEEDVTLMFDDLSVTQTISVTSTSEEETETSETSTIGESISGQEILTSICEINAVFGHINREGKLTYITPSSTVDITVEQHNYSSCTYEDYTVQPIDSLTIEETEDDIGVTVTTEAETTDNTYTITDNFLLYGLEEKELETIGESILAAICNVTYCPFSLNFIGNPCYEVGDRISVTTTYDVVESLILSRTITGIQSLMDTVSATGEEYRTSDVNSLERQILQLQGKSNTLSRTLDSTVSTITDLSSNLSSVVTQTASLFGITISGVATYYCLWYSPTIAPPRPGESYGVAYTDVGLTDENVTDEDASADWSTDYPGISNNMYVWFCMQVITGSNEDAEEGDAYEVDYTVSYTVPALFTGDSIARSAVAELELTAEGLTLQLESAQSTINELSDYLSVSYIESLLSVWSEDESNNYVLYRSLISTDFSDGTIYYTGLNSATEPKTYSQNSDIWSTDIPTGYSYIWYTIETTYTTTDDDTGEETVHYSYTQPEIYTSELQDLFDAYAALYTLEELEDDEEPTTYYEILVAAATAYMDDPDDEDLQTAYETAYQNYLNAIGDFEIAYNAANTAISELKTAIEISEESSSIQATYNELIDGLQELYDDLANDYNMHFEFSDSGFAIKAWEYVTEETTTTDEDGNEVTTTTTTQQYYDTSVLIRNSGLYLMLNDTAVACVAADGSGTSYLDITNARINNSLVIGNFAFIPRGDEGAMSLVWQEDD